MQIHIYANIRVEVFLMITIEKAKQLGATILVLGALAAVPFGANAMVTGVDVKGDEAEGGIMVHKQHLSDDYVYIPKVGYVKVKSDS
ncbi:MAG: hypothetical protein MAG794_01456 [Gammaproteobacteria bacterium]|nr:hypothetical protein [Gammaproteobacteria bacterium]